MRFDIYLLNRGIEAYSTEKNIGEKWSEEATEAYGKYFLTQEMRDLYLDNKETEEEILTIRKELIMNAEKAFVEKWGLNYEEEDMSINSTEIS